MNRSTAAGRWLGRRLEPLIFAHRRQVASLFALLTLLFAWQAAALRLDVAFDRAQPAGALATRLAERHRGELGGDNPVRIAVLRREGTIYDRVFLTRLKALTDGIAHLPGIDPRHLRSLFSPELRHIEVRESQYFGVSVVPEGFDPEQATRAQLLDLRERVHRAGLVGERVSRDQRGVLIEAAWRGRDPQTGVPYPQRMLAQALHEVVRAAEAAGGGDFRVHVLGAPTLAVALAAEAPAALLFACAAIACAGLLLIFALGSLRVALIALALLPLALVAQLGLLNLRGTALDPDAAWALAIPACAGLIAAAQFGLHWLTVAAEGGRSGFESSLETWRVLAAPIVGSLAFMAVAAAALAAICDVPLSRQVAEIAATGLAVWVPLIGVLLPVLLSATGTVRIRWRLADGLDARLSSLAGLARPAAGAAVLVAIGALSGFSAWQQRGQPVEPASADLLRLSPDNPVRIDAQRVAAAFPATVMSARLIVETDRDACTDVDVLEQLDQLVWQLENLPGVLTVSALPAALRRVLSAFGDGSPKFRALARSPETLTQAMAPISTDSGLHARDCAVLPVTVQLARRDNDMLSALAAEIERYNRRNAEEFQRRHADADLAACAERQRLRAANDPVPGKAMICPLVAVAVDGPLGLAMARQGAVAALLQPAALLALAVMLLAGLLLLGSGRAALAVLVPLAFAGWLALGLSAASGAALTLLTLPLWLCTVVAGFGSYLLVIRSVRHGLQIGLPIDAALRTGLVERGRPLLVMLVMSAGFACWIAAGYPAQRGVGKLLAISTATIGLVGVLVLPALAALLLGERASGEREDG